MKQKQKNLIKDLPMDPLEFSQQEYASSDHMNVLMDSNACPGTTPTAKISENLEKVEPLMF